MTVLQKHPWQLSVFQMCEQGLTGKKSLSYVKVLMVERLESGIKGTRGELKLLDYPLLRLILYFPLCHEAVEQSEQKPRYSDNIYHALNFDTRHNISQPP